MCRDVTFAKRSYHGPLSRMTSSIYEGTLKMDLAWGAGMTCAGPGCRKEWDALGWFGCLRTPGVRYFYVYVTRYISDFYPTPEVQLYHFFPNSCLLKWYKFFY